MKYEYPCPSITAWIGSLALVAALFTGCTNKAAQQKFERPPAPVTVAAATSQDVPTYLDAIGKTVARETVFVQPQVSGRILKIHFTDGANVSKGQLLFTIDPRPFEANVRQAQANVSKDLALKKQAEANLARDIAQSKYGDIEARRNQTLVEQGVVSRSQFEQAQSNSESLKATVEADRAAIHTAEEAIKSDAAAVDSAKVELSYCYIHSPIDGRAGQRLADVGNVVSPGGGANAGTAGSDTPPSNALLVIERLDPIYADFTIPQDQLANVQLQMHAGSLKTEIRLPDWTDPVAGQLTFLDNAVQNSTGTINLRATVSNSGHRLWPGRFVNIRLVLNTLRGAVLVPATAPQMSAKGSFVYIVKADSTAEQRPVSLGQKQGDLIVVEQGVAAGERVVTVGQVGVTPGGKVRVEEPPKTDTTSGAK